MTKVKELVPKKKEFTECKCTPYELCGCKKDDYNQALADFQPLIEYASALEAKVEKYEKALDVILDLPDTFACPSVKNLARTARGGEKG